MSSVRIIVITPSVGRAGLSAQRGGTPVARSPPLNRSVEADVLAHPVGVAVEDLLAQRVRRVREAALQRAALQHDVPALVLARLNIDQSCPPFAACVFVLDQAAGVLVEVLGQFVGAYLDRRHLGLLRFGLWSLA